MRLESLFPCLQELFTKWNDEQPWEQRSAPMCLISAMVWLVNVLAITLTVSPVGSSCKFLQVSLFHIIYSVIHIIYWLWLCIYRQIQADQHLKVKLTSLHSSSGKMSQAFYLFVFLDGLKQPLPNRRKHAVRDNRLSNGCHMHASASPAEALIPEC